MITDEPGRPGKPEIFDYDNQSVSLRWTKPESDGGRELTHYTVEMKDKLSVEWVEVFKTADPTCEAKVEGLKEKMIYQFRIRAHNKAGGGEPSEPTDNHICKHKNRKCRLQITTLTNLEGASLIRIINGTKSYLFNDLTKKLFIDNKYYQIL